MPWKKYAPHKNQKFIDDAKSIVLKSNQFYFTSYDTRLPAKGGGGK
jgi:hypothetical protein